MLSLLRPHSRAFSLRIQWRRACGHFKIAPNLPPLPFPDLVSLFVTICLEFDWPTRHRASLASMMTSGAPPYRSRHRLTTYGKRRYRESAPRLCAPFCSPPLSQYSFPDVVADQSGALVEHAESYRSPRSEAMWDAWTSAPQCPSGRSKYDVASRSGTPRFMTTASSIGREHMLPVAMLPVKANIFGGVPFSRTSGCSSTPPFRNRPLFSSGKSRQCEMALDTPVCDDVARIYSLSRSQDVELADSATDTELLSGYMAQDDTPIEQHCATPDMTVDWTQDYAQTERITNLTPACHAWPYLSTPDSTSGRAARSSSDNQRSSEQAGDGFEDTELMDRITLAPSPSLGRRSNTTKRTKRRMVNRHKLLRTLECAIS